MANRKGMIANTIRKSIDKIINPTLTNAYYFNPKVTPPNMLNPCLV